jgi:hypothetical protein
LETAIKIDFFHFTAFLHKPVGFFILPACLYNTAIVISSNIAETLAQHYSIGIALGLMLENHWVFIF